MKQKEILDLDELCKYVNMSKSTIYKHLQTGRFPGIKIGRQWRFQRTYVDQWLSKQATALISNESDSLPSQITQVAANSRKKQTNLYDDQWKEIFSEKQLARLAANAIDSPMTIIVMIATQKGKTKFQEIVGLSDYEMEQKAMKLTVYFDEHM